MPEKIPCLPAIVAVRAAIILLLSGLCSISLAAQSEAASQPPAAEPIRVSQIADQSRQSRTLLSRHRSDLATSSLPSEGKELLESTPIEMDRLTMVQRERSVEFIATELLRDRLTEWERIELELASLDAQLTQRIAELNQQLDSLRTAAEVWALTIEAAGLEELPAEVVGRLAELTDEIEEVRGLLRARRSELLTLQALCSDLLADGREELNRLRVVLESRAKELFSLDRPPLWSFASEPIEGRLTDVLRRDWQAMREFVARSLGPLAAQLALFLAISLWFRALGRRAAVMAAEDESMASAAAILSRPFAAALLPTIYLGGAFLYVQPPTIWGSLMRLVLVICLVRVLPIVSYPRIRTLLLWLAGLYVVDRISMVAGYGTSLERLLLLAVSGVAVLLLWRLRPAILELQGSKKGWVGILRGGIYISMGVLVSAALANVIGAVTLSETLQHSLMTTIYTGLLFRLLFLILNAVTAVSLRSNAAQAVLALRSHPEIVQRRLSQLFLAIMVFSWSALVLDQVDLLGQLQGGIQGLMAATFSVGSVTITVGNIVMFGFVVWLSFALSKLIRFLLEEQVMPSLAMPTGAAAAVSQLTHYFVLLVGFLLAVSAAGIDVSSFAVRAGAFGVGIGFGLQGIVNNFVSGLVLLFERPIKVGDRIQAGEQIGDVRRIGIRASILRTLDGAEVIVPNANLVSAEVINWTLSDPRRRANVPIGVAYGTNPKAVIEMLTEVASNNARVLKFPVPEAFFLAHGESSLDFELRAWVTSREYFDVRSELTTAVNEALREAGIEIPFPQRDLHLKSVRDGLLQDASDSRAQDPEGDD